FDSLRRRRAAVHAMVRWQPPPGLPDQVSGWFWEEYNRLSQPGTECLAFARVVVTDDQLQAIKNFYDQITVVGGVEVSPMSPLIGWLLDIEQQEAYLVRR